MPKSPVWFDCDTGIDDALALAQLAASPSIDLVGVSTVSGNIDAAQAARNTLDLLALLGRDDVPVAVGSHDPLVGKYAGGAPEVHGGNGIGDVQLARSPREVQTRSGVEELLAAARAHAGELHLIAVGPLTNLAHALVQEPELPSLVKHVTIMGGAVWVPGNLTAHAEANIANDAEAARIVFRAGWPVTLVPLDVTHAHTFDTTAYEALLARDTALHKALAGMLDCYLSFHETRHGVRASALHDPLATMLATGAVEASTVRSTGLVVDTTEEQTRARTLAVEVDALHPVVDVVTEVADPVGPRLLELLLALPGR
ncbi:nucleoside hydrolase [Kineosporia rhizophila]|uniref:nucleoside hydrolase n=1 Tax=Kineosporia rhizophila TaxID=84633 RepID=UPI001E4E6038|nr:nucleoside hydrolase [Kineosporia rhizophila]MCE0539589.1 nucleoside hydrolase [Kineosporia rhizophila]